MVLVVVMEAENCRGGWEMVVGEIKSRPDSTWVFMPSHTPLRCRTEKGEQNTSASGELVREPDESYDALPLSLCRPRRLSLSNGVLLWDQQSWMERP